jgi:peptidoglycan-associated lipoprotein
MKQFYHILIIVLIVILSLPLGGCSGTNHMGKAKKAYDIGEYYRASGSLNRVYRREKNKYYKGEISYYLGHSYRNTNQPRRAASAFSRAIRYGYPEIKTLLYQAQELQKTGKFEDALVLYDQYMAEVFGDQLAYNGKASCNLALNPPPPTLHKVEEQRKLNSRNSDFAPFIDPDDPSQLYFTSLRYEKKKHRQESHITGQGYSAIYTIIQNSRGEWMTPELLLEEEAQTQWEDGVLSITADNSEAYFTRTRFDTPEPLGAEIWTIKKMGGRWGDATKVILGPDSLIYAHPAISPDGKILYFVSDMPGGKGGKDIWTAFREGENWSVPVNLGPDINTAGDEMFPYVRDNGLFYFSSNGQIGYGGLDIFEAKNIEGDRWKIRNMGQPINSMGDDFGITFHQNREAGYFSSSRNNSKGIDNIFSFETPIIQPVLSGLVSIGNQQPLPENTKARIIGTEGTNTTIKLQPSGIFNLLLKPENNYIIQVSAPGYYNHTEKINTNGLTESKKYEIQINLKPVTENVQ